MDAESRKIPSHEVTYARLRDMILYGHLAPGAPVTIQGLIADLGAGMTPVREAIRRLTAEGALLPQGNRRVAVPEMSAAMLEQVAFARLAIEPNLAARAADRLTTSEINRLEAIDAKVNQAIEAGKLTDYLAANHAFHFALYEAGAAGPGAVALAAGGSVPARGDRPLWPRDGAGPAPGGAGGNAQPGCERTGRGNRARYPAGDRPRPSGAGRLTPR
jgi:hypothetical protein